MWNPTYASLEGSTYKVPATSNRFQSVGCSPSDTGKFNEPALWTETDCTLRSLQS